MPIKSGPGGTMITGENSITYFQLVSLKGALRLESVGMKHSRGSVAQRVREITGLKTRDKKKLLEQFKEYINQKYPTRESAQ